MRIAIFGLISAHAGRNRGGTAVSIVRLANHFVSRGHEVDLVCIDTALDQEVMAGLDSRVGRHPLRRRKRISILLALIGYLRRRRPDAMVSFDTRANSLAALVRRIPFIGRPVIASIRNSIEARQRGNGAHRDRLLRRIVHHADAVVAISHGLADEMARATDVPVDRIRVIHNLVVDDALHARADGRVDHSWFRRPRGKREKPVILGVGRLEGQKDFPTLLRAFALLRRERDARLVILGRGSQADALDRLAQELGIGEDVDFPGFMENPVAWMASADVFVLSSRAEGFGMVLAEAMAAGCAVVSTDCMSGPREILADGRYGPLVPVGDATAMAQAIRSTLDRPPQAQELRNAAERFSVQRNGDAFLELVRHVAHA